MRESEESQQEEKPKIPLKTREKHSGTDEKVRPGESGTDKCRYGTQG